VRFRSKAIRSRPPCSTSETPIKVVDLKINNQGSTYICAIVISPLRPRTGGGDNLSSRVTIQSGSSHALKVATGDYDILMVDCSGNTILQDNGVVDHEARHLHGEGSDPNASLAAVCRSCVTAV
jgi:hypothetical protein